MKPVLLLGLLLLLFGCAGNHPPLRLVGQWHRVQSGDTIKSVARQYDVTPEEVAELNDLASNDALRGREEIFVPTADGSVPGTGAAPAKPKNAVAGPSQSAATPRVATKKSSDADGRLHDAEVG